MFKCKPLADAEQQIRIINLERGLYDDPLKGSLIQEYLDSEPIYNALSYSVGDGESVCDILLTEETDFSPLKITANLDKALRRLRSDEADYRVWVDAISIDQQDDEEKRKQVRLMTRIYTQAAHVKIYLGEEDRDSPDAFALFDSISNAMQRSVPDPSLVKKDSQWIAYHKLPSVMESYKWEPLKAFFRRQWFQRKWTIQEAILASRATVVLGKYSRDWSDMEAVVLATYAYGLAVQDWTTYKNVRKATDLKQGINQLRAAIEVKKARQRGKEYGILELTDLFQPSRARDPRDHVFSLLGIASDVGSRELDPDYKETNTVLKNSIRYARYFLEQGKNLEVLYRAGLQGHELHAPSWVPDLYGNHEGSWFEVNLGPWDPLRRPPKYHVAPGSTVSLVGSDGLTAKDVFGVRGIRIDVVADLANDHFKFETNHMDKDLMRKQQVRHMEDSDKIIYKIKKLPADQTPEEVLWRTLICNVTRDLQPASLLVGASYRAWRKSFTVEGAEPFVADIDPIREVFDEPFGVFNHGKVFGVTKEGYAGIFPRATKKDDLIYVLFGGEFPFVVRQIESQYQLVGQCYIHGIMEGQLDFSKFETEDVFLGGPYTKSEIRMDASALSPTHYDG